MSVQNEELVEELLWEAYKQDKAIELIDLAYDIQKVEGFVDRTVAFQKAFEALNLAQKE
jgi:hypothetical protein